MITEEQSGVIDLVGSPATHRVAAVDRIDTHSAVVFLAGELEQPPWQRRSSDISTSASETGARSPPHVCLQSKGSAGRRETRPARLDRRFVMRRWVEADCVQHGTARQSEFTIFGLFLCTPISDK